MRRLLSCTFVTVGMLLGCGSDDDSSKASDGSGGSAGAGGGSSGGAAGAAGGGEVRPSPGCASSASAAGLDEMRSLDHDGVERTYQLHVPASYDGETPTAVVLNFHGFTPIVGPQAASAQASLSGLVAKSDDAGFIAVHPQGLLEGDGTTASWNAGTCCSTDSERDDVGFIAALIDTLGADLCIDERRVYSTGLSNGGIMSHFLACRLADRIAAIAPVAGVNGAMPCEPGRPVGVVAFHGTSDALVPYTGGVTAVDDWVARNGCSSDPEETFNNGDSRCERYTGCQGDVEVELCTVEDGGHTWPGGSDLPSVPGLPDLGKTTQDLSANDEMWSFFQRHALP